MSRMCMKTKPVAGTVVLSVWTYVIVSVRQDSFKPGTWNIFEYSKHAKLDQAKEALDSWREQAREYALEQGRIVPTNEHYFLAEWKQVDGKCVCVLMDDPLLASI